MQPNLAFNGNAAEALAHYRDAFGGDLNIMRFAGSPAAGEVPAEWSDKVLYGTLSSPLGVVNTMDAPPGRGPQMPGDNFSIGVLPASAAQAEAVFAKLAAGGSVLMPLEKTFWAERFGMVTDKFGIKWMINYGAR
jgi:PhnB protein